MRITALPLLTVLCLQGCYLAHAGDEPGPRFDASPGRDSGPRRDTEPPFGFDAGPPPVRLDAGPPPVRFDAGRFDAGPREGDYWSLERRDADLRIEHELGCTQYEGGSIALSVSAPIENECEYAGPVTTTTSSDGTVVVTAYLWVRHRTDESLCLDTNARSERTLLFPAQEGVFQAVSDDGDSRVTYQVSAIDGRPCGANGAAGDECLLDCECGSGMVCIPQLGDIVMCQGGRCGEPCNSQGGSLRPYYAPHLGCERGEQCRPGPAFGAFSCQPPTEPGCAAGSGSRDCGPGLDCISGSEETECVWQLRLTGSNRHLCESDAECDEGLVCVEHGDSPRRCEVPCFSNGMRCPIMHHCSPEHWVCEWDGE